MKVLGATPELLASICRYVEAKCLLGGTTTSQGITLANAAGIRRYFRGVVRNVEATDEAALPPASTRVPDVAARDAQAFLTRLKRQKTCYLLHLSEGLDATAHRAFEALQLAPGEWAITPSLCGIHAAALKAPVAAWSGLPSATCCCTAAPPMSAPPRRPACRSRSAPTGHPPGAATNWAS
jgi:hypothetical protein